MNKPVSGTRWFLYGTSTLLLAAVLLATTPAQALPECQLRLNDGRGVAAAGCNAPGVASAWVAVFYDCWIVGSGSDLLGLNGITDSGQILLLNRGFTC